MALTTEPTIVNRFVLTIDGINKMPGIKSIGGIGQRVTPSPRTAQTQDGKSFQEVVPGIRQSTGSLQVAGYFTPADDIAKWFFRIRAGKEEPKGGSIKLSDYNGEAILQWTLERAWPSQLAFGALDAGAQEAPLGQMVLQYDGLKLEG